ncbi:MAG TPA: SulP family inorganic anion transporter [Microvirga sp.]|jgi:SulP family sulfate permease|nr:SulP family inorganic anion transporter [Microvirga sp.]
MLPTRLDTPRPSFAELFTPKLVSVLRRGYGLPQLQADMVAGLTVAIVALPLSMAIAIASGAGPERGLYTAIVGGFLISALGGSRYQIGGPAGAFIVLVAASIERHGFSGFLLATLLAGLMLIAIGFLRLGSYIRYIPHPVTIGFTAGIAVIIFASQIRDLLGLTLAGREPAALLPKVDALWAAAPTASPAAIGVAAGTIALILALRRYRPTWPGFLIAVVAASAAVSLAHLPVETIGSRFGGIPNALPLPQLPTITAERILEVLPDALAFALLGGIESLLSAVVADAMGGTRHRSNMELVAQGVANVGCAFFGGICATGTIARTATNVRSGAFSPVAGMLHAAFLLAFMLFAAPLASYIPLAALAGILAVVAWNMAERHEFWSILRRSRGEAAVLLATFLTTLLRDLTEGIVVGVVLGSFLFMHRMAELVSVETGTPLLSEDGPDDADAAPVGPGDGNVAVFRITGPLFFGASTKIATTLDRIGRFPKIAILDLSAVPLADSSAAASLKEFVARGRNNGAQVFVAGANPVVRRALEREHLGLPAVAFAPTIADARMAAQLDTSSMEASRS